MHDFENAVNNQEAGSFERNKQTKVLEGGVEEVCVSVCVVVGGGVVRMGRDLHCA